MAVTDAGVPGGSLAVDEETDLQLLDQHLLKTNALSQRMTTILSQLDSRLSRLDKSITPLGIRQLTRQVNNVDAILEQLAPGSSSVGPQLDKGLTPSGSIPASLNEAGSTSSLAVPSPSTMSPSQRFSRQGPIEPAVTKPKSKSGDSMGPSVMDRKRAIPRPDVIPRWQQDSVVVSSPSSTVQEDPLASGSERQIVERGPDIMSLAEYFDALKVVIRDLEQMYKGMQEGRGGSREQGVADLSGVVETAFRRLVDMLLAKVKETMPRPFDSDHLINTSPQPVTTYYPPMSSVKTLANGLVGIVEPSTPTPRTSQILTPVLSRCITDLSVLRGEWLRRSLTGLAQKVEDTESKGQGRNGEKVRLTMQLWDTFLVAAEAEVQVAQTLLPGAAGERLTDLTLPYGQKMASATTNQIIGTIKRSLSDHNMVLLDLYAALVAFQPRYDESMSKILGDDVPDVSGAVAGPVGTLRSLAQRSFPERLVDISTLSRNQGVPTTTIDEATHSTLAYLEELPAYGMLVETLLRSTGRGERSWLMGMKVPPSTARSADEEGGLVNLYAADVLGTLMNHLDARAKAMRSPIGSAFLLNNLSHIRNTASSFNADIIGPGAEDMLNRQFREAKSGYLTEWQGLVQLLSHTAQPRFNVGPSSDKQSTKEAAASFFERLTELENTCRQYPLNRADPELRERVGSEVAELVNAGYSSFWNKAHARGFDKYLRQTPEDLTRRVQTIFR